MVLRPVARVRRRAGLAERSLRAVAGFGSALGRLLPVVGGRRGLHSGEDIQRALQARFETRELSYGAYFFPDLSDTGEADELAAIDAGQIQANRIQYHGSRRETRT